MTPKQFNGIYRPLVKIAWENYCIRTGISPNKKDAYRLWYEAALRDATRGRITTTKDATPKELQHLVAHFQAMVAPSDTIPMYGWTDSQMARFQDLAHAAHRAAQADGEPRAFLPYIESILRRHKVQQNDAGRWHFPDRKESFDHIMADLAVRANDTYWITRTAAAAETRIRWQLEQFLIDLDYLDKRFVHDWQYIRGIYKQSDMLPADINDCPAVTLWKVLQMLDTHIRRICKDFDVKPMDLPTRAHPHDHLKISETAHHLHIGHKLEHVAPVEVHAAPAEEYDPTPF
jgi:hypothetical protein